MRKMFVICDLDGTLADISHRRQFAESGDFPSFEHPLNVEQDKLNHRLCTLLDILVKNGHKVYLFSGRTDAVRDTTEKWLEDNEVLYHKLYMRKAGDSRDDVIVKREMLQESGLNLDDILCVFDDRNKVVAEWRRLGLLCFQVAEGDF